MRTVVLLIIQYYCLARLADVRLLRAADLRLTSLEGVPAIEIFFRAAKNDQLAEGNRAHLIAEGGMACPYRVLKLYYARMSYFFNDGEIMDSNFLLPRLRMAKKTRILVADGRYAISQTSLVSGMRELAKAVGFEPPISGKSAKIAGTSASFANGLSDEDIRDKGRWKTTESALYYRRLAESYRLKLARAISIQTQPWKEQRQPEAQTQSVYDPDIQFQYHKWEQEVAEIDAQLEECLVSIIHID